MCGIAGCLALGGAAVPDQDWVGAAAARIGHRGPDDQGCYADADIALGYRRLAIIDLSAGGHQPMRSASGRYWMVFNGEIYNYLELGQELRARGVVLRSASDSEVLLETYARTGPDVVHRLRGMFAFAIWDTVSRELFCARDPFGIKPFFYTVGGEDGEPGHTRLLRFASERQAVAGAGPGGRAVAPAALRQYLTFQYVPAAQTMTGPVVALPPGHTLTARPGGEVRAARYWRAELRPQPGNGSRPGRGLGRPGQILAALRDSVAVHLRSDAPLGAFLSGGVDSAAICALAAEHRPDLLTFTVGFERPGYSEIDHAERTAAALGLKSLSHVITAAEFFACLPRIIGQLDDPVADAAAIPLWFVAREASRHVKVVLSGEGSDELFGGYHGYHQPGLIRACQRLPGWGRAPLRRVAALIPPGVRGRGFLERASIPLGQHYIPNARVFPEAQVDALAGPGLARLARPGPAGARAVTGPSFAQARAAGLDDVSTMQLVDINTWLPGDILAKADRMSMAHSLELRVPFLDREVLAVAARLTRAEKIGAGTTKLALRQALRDVLPAAVAERPKLGFPVPIGPWLRGEAREFAEQVLTEAQTSEWIDRAAALRVLRRFQAGQRDVSWRQVYALIVFSLWHQIHIEGRSRPPGTPRSAAAAR